MHIAAAVAQRKGEPFQIRELELGELRVDEVRVRMVACGVCHTDAIVRDQVYPTPLPAVLGHEGAGIVEAIGAAVTQVEIGDHVVLSANSCGTCAQCLTGQQAYCNDLFARNFGGRRADGSTSLTDGGRPVSSFFFGQSSFSTSSNVAVRCVVKVDSEVDLAAVAPLGCGIQTGAGAILNQLRPPAGSSVAVFGAGAVGAGAIMAARLTGATTIIAVDVNPQRLGLAEELGATHTVNSTEHDLATRLQQITRGGGVDFILDTTGLPHLLSLGARNLAIRGTLALVGAAPPNTEAPFEIGESLSRGWTFTTIVEGSSVPQIFIPALIDLWRQGRFPFHKLTKTFSFTDINRAFAESAAGTTIKPIIVF